MQTTSSTAGRSRRRNPLKSITALTLTALAVLCNSTPAEAVPVPILGSSLASFAVLGASGVTNVPVSTIGGNLGAAPSAAVGGGYIFASGSLQANTALAQKAQIELDKAILDVNAKGPGTNITGGNLDAWQGSHGGFIIPGTYTVPAASTNLTGALILDGGGSNSAVWAFLFPTTLITSTTSTVSVVNVGDGANVGLYWSVGTGATLNGNSFAGNVLATTISSSDGGLTMTCGRLLSSETQVTLKQDTISIGCGKAGDVGFGSGGFDQGAFVGSGGEGGSNGQVVPEPGSLALLGLGLAALGWGRGRQS